jgi:pimeloyl-ACP methyl ester carboxylesterase
VEPAGAWLTLRSAGKCSPLRGFWSKTMYEPRRISRSSYVSVRGLRYRIRCWGPEEGEPFVLLHGGRDASATFQFMVDCFERDWRIVAPDWRGHGKSERAPQGYWFPDYLADLDAILEQFFPGRPVPLAGHSLGGNAACTYAGLRPGRVSRLISLDGFGLPDLGPQAAPAQLRRWLAGWRQPPQQHSTYASIEEMAARLAQANPRLDKGKALFLASELRERLPDGRYTWDFDPLHRAPFATLHRRAEWAACLALVQAPTLFIGSDLPFPPALRDEPEGLAARAAAIPHARFERVAGAGHNLHHDEPEAVARLVEGFLAAE